ncbi:MAG: hypothetical protein IIC78_14195 [Chloroflexi bacterium]|nr:hypothetical protein [Chloroflexota bacterium]
MTKDSERAQIGWSFWLAWMLASTVVLAVGITVGGVVIVFGAAVAVEGRGILIGAVGGAVVGASLGIVHWFVLRWKVSGSARWILANAAGGAVGFALAVAVLRILDLVDSGFFSISVDADDRGATWLVIVIAIGASYGIAQWLVLRRKVSRSGRWILANPRVRP